MRSMLSCATVELFMVLLAKLPPHPCLRQAGKLQTEDKTLAAEAVPSPSHILIAVVQGACAYL